MDEKIWKSSMGKYIRVINPTVREINLLLKAGCELVQTPGEFVETATKPANAEVKVTDRKYIDEQIIQIDNNLRVLTNKGRIFEYLHNTIKGWYWKELDLPDFKEEK